MEKKLWILLLLLTVLVWDVKMNNASISAVLIIAFWMGVAVPLSMVAVVCVFMLAVPRKRVRFWLTFLGAFAGWCLSWYLGHQPWGGWLVPGGDALGYLFSPALYTFVGALGTALATATPVPPRPGH